MKRLEAIIERPLALLLLPLSLLPFFLVVPEMIEARELYDRRHKSGPLSAPDVSLNAGQQRRFQPVAGYSGAIPVLAYHGIRDERDGYSVSRRTFAEQMAALKRMGFSTITAEQFARFRRGDSRGLPARPLLITFDDGRLDSYRGADAVLERHGFRATMFVITSHIERKNPFYLTWKELHRMEDSGRWGIEPHAHEGHSKVVYGSLGNSLPYYAVRRYTRSEGLESFADYERRVSEDLFAVREKMLDQGFEPHAFAVPYGNYGQRETNDPAIAAYMRALMHRQFGVYFVQDEENDPDYAGATGEAARFEVHSDTTTDRLYMWLRDHSPGRAAQEATRP